MPPILIIPIITDSKHISFIDFKKPTAPTAKSLRKFKTVSLWDTCTKDTFRTSKHTVL